MMRVRKVEEINVGTDPTVKSKPGVENVVMNNENTCCCSTRYFCHRN